MSCLEEVLGSNLGLTSQLTNISLTKKIVIVVSSLDDLCLLYLLLYNEVSLAQHEIILKYSRNIWYHWSSRGMCLAYCARGLRFKSWMDQSTAAHMVNEKAIIFIIPSLDDLSFLFILLYNEESLEQYGIFLKC